MELKCGFGKYLGRSYDSIPLQYILWMLVRASDLNESELVQAKRQLDKYKLTNKSLIVCQVGLKWKGRRWESIPDCYLHWLSRQTRYGAEARYISLLHIGYRKNGSTEQK